MRINFAVEVPKGGLFDPLLAAQIVQEESARGVSEALILVSGPIAQRTPVNTGTLRSSEQMTSVAELLAMPPENVVGQIGTSLAYGAPVEFGTRAHWAPIGPLKLWAKRKLGDEGAAYGVQKAIAKRGTKGRYMFTDTFHEYKEDILSRLQQIGARIAARLGGGS